VVTSLTNTALPTDRAAALRARVWPLGLSAAALALGSVGLGQKGLWLDEIASLNFALGGPEVWIADHNMALYYTLLAGWTQLFGIGEVALRSLSVLLFAASTLAFWALALRLFGVRCARIAGVLYVTSPTLVQYAQEARGYMLELLLVNTATLLLVQLPERRSARLAAGYAALMGLALYAHLFAVWVALVHGLFLLGLWSRRALPFRLLLVALAPPALLAVPLALGVMRTGAGQISWIYPPSPERIWGALVTLAGGSWLLALADAALFVLFARAALRAERRRGEELLLLGWCGAPALLSYGYSWLVAPIAHPKYLIVSLPALLLCAGVALSRFSPRALAGVLGAMLLLCAGRLYVWYAQYQKELWREVAALLAARGRPADALVLDVMLAEPLDYYVVRGQLAARMPRLVRPQRAWGYPPADPPPLDAELLRTQLREAPQVWLVRNRANGFDAQYWLGATHQLRETLTFEPRDADDRALYADPGGRVITVQRFSRAAR
jgi:4-amino-4-deoxy-L-arabinose transferase-like glycosyltransferase